MIPAVDTSLVLTKPKERDQTLPIERVYVFTDMREYQAWIKKEGGSSKSVHTANLIIVDNEVLKNRYSPVGTIT